MIRYLIGKLRQPVVVISVWACVPLAPFIAARVGLFNILLIEGRCVRPSLAACGQDNATLAYVGLTLFTAAFAGVVTWAMAQWDEWKQEYVEQCRENSKPAKEPEKVDWT